MANTTCRYLLCVALIVFCAARIASAGAVVFDLVEDYGIDVTAADPAVDKALADAKRHLSSHPSDTVVIYFPAGTYDFVKLEDSITIAIEGFTHGKLVLRGDGTDKTTLRFERNPGNGPTFDIRGCTNIAVEKIHFTLSELCTSQGTVISAGSGVIDFELHEGFPDPVILFNNVDHKRFEFAVFEFCGSDDAPEMSGSLWRDPTHGRK